MDDYEVKPNQASLYKVLLLVAAFMFWPFVTLPLIDYFIGYYPELADENLELAYKLSNKRVLIQTYLLNIPLIALFVYIAVYCFKVLRYKRIPPRGWDGANSALPLGLAVR